MTEKPEKAHKKPEEAKEKLEKPETAKEKPDKTKEARSRQMVVNLCFLGAHKPVTEELMFRLREGRKENIRFGRKMTAEVRFEDTTISHLHCELKLKVEQDRFGKKNYSLLLRDTSSGGTGIQPAGLATPKRLIAEQDYDLFDGSKIVLPFRGEPSTKKNEFKIECFVHYQVTDIIKKSGGSKDAANASSSVGKGDEPSKDKAATGAATKTSPKDEKKTAQKTSAAVGKIGKTASAQTPAKTLSPPESAKGKKRTAAPHEGSAPQKAARTPQDDLKAFEAEIEKQNKAAEQRREKTEVAETARRRALEAEIEKERQAAEQLRKKQFEAEIAQTRQAAEEFKRAAAAAEETKQRAEEELRSIQDARRRADEAEKRRIAEAEETKRRLAEEIEEARRAAAEAEARRVAEAKARWAEVEAERARAAAAARRAAEAEALRAAQAEERRAEDARQAFDQVRRLAAAEAARQAEMKRLEQQRFLFEQQQKQLAEATMKEHQQWLLDQRMLLEQQAESVKKAEEIAAQHRATQAQQAQQMQDAWQHQQQAGFGSNMMAQNGYLHGASAHSVAGWQQQQQQQAPQVHAAQPSQPGVSWTDSTWENADSVAAQLGWSSQVSGPPPKSAWGQQQLRPKVAETLQQQVASKWAPPQRPLALITPAHHDAGQAAAADWPASKPWPKAGGAAQSSSAPAWNMAGGEASSPASSPTAVAKQGLRPTKPLLRPLPRPLRPEAAPAEAAACLPRSAPLDDSGLDRARLAVAAGALMDDPWAAYPSNDSATVDAVLPVLEEPEPEDPLERDLKEGVANLDKGKEADVNGDVENALKYYKVGSAQIIQTLKGLPNTDPRIEQYRARVASSISRAEQMKTGAAKARQWE